MVRKSRKSRAEWKIYKNVFDSFTEKNLFLLSSQGHFVELNQPIALGKEANVFLARKKDDTHIIVKIYRLENCNFNKMFYYISADPRFLGLENQKRKVIFSWVQREYRNLLLAREQITVPTPIAFKDNILLMKLIGEDVPAPKLKDHIPENPEKFFKKVIKRIKQLIDANLIHGDLSEFNILNHKNDPVFIDMSQSTPLKTQNSRELLERDLVNVCKFFNKHMKVDVEAVKKDVFKHFDSKNPDKL